MRAIAPVYFAPNTYKAYVQELVETDHGAVLNFLTMNIFT